MPIDLEPILARLQSDPAAQEELAMALQSGIMGDGTLDSSGVSEGGEAPPSPSNVVTPSSIPPSRQEGPGMPAQSAPSGQDPVLNQLDPQVNPEMTPTSGPQTNPDTMQADKDLAMATADPTAMAQEPMQKNLGDLISAVVTGQIMDEGQAARDFPPEVIAQFTSLPPEVLEQLRMLTEKNFQNNQKTS